LPPNGKKFLLTLFLAAALVLVCALHLREFYPSYNWDLVGYIAVAHSFNGEKNIHGATYRDVKRYVPRAFVDDLLDGGSNYRVKIAQNAEYLSEQIPFYAVKPVYPFLMLITNKITGVSLVTTSVWISRAAYVAAMLTLFLWLSPTIGSLLSFLISVAIASSAYVLQLGRLSTPDALCMLATVLTWWLFVGGYPLVSLALAVLMVGIRPDNLLLAILLGGAVLVVTEHRFWAGALIVLAVVFYAALTYYAHHPGWGVHFYHSFGARLLKSDLAPSISIRDYAFIYANQLRPSLNLSLWQFVPLLIAAVAVSFKRGPQDRIFRMLAINLAFIVLHWCAYPGETNRLLVPAYVITFIGLALSCALPAFQTNCSTAFLDNPCERNSHYERKRGQHDR
jgi:hypothetical protein